MIEEIPKESRWASRAILIDGADRVLFFHAQDPTSKRVFWSMPGGGLDAGESFEEAVCRETFEETGISIRSPKWVWFRRHQHEWNGKPADQYERFFVAQLDEKDVKLAGAGVDSYVIGYRWWSLNEILASDEVFVPARVGALIEPILRGHYPATPFDCGI